MLDATVASCMLALWMVPAALDLAVLEPGVRFVKIGMWAGQVACCALRGRGCRRSSLRASSAKRHG